MYSSKNSGYAASIEAILAGEIKVLSLDFFDTLIWRNVSSPRDVFLYVGKKLQDKGLLGDATDLQLFAHAREIAEQSARRQHALPSGAMEVNLEEIYACFPIDLVNCTVRDLVQEEEQSEYLLCHYNASLTGLIQAALQHCERIIISSDTWHAASTLMTIVRRQIPLLNGTEIKVFTSAVYRLPKPLGLFQVITAELELPAWDILHIGDNLISDVQVPAELGLRVCHTPRLEFQFPRIFKQEQEALRGSRQSGLLAQDSGLSWYRGCPVVRSETDQSSLAQGEFLRNYGRAFLGPLLVSFVSWVLEENRRLQSDANLFLMRDGRLLRRIAAVLSDQTPAAEFWLNRFTATKAAIFTDNPRSLQRHLRSSVGIPLGNVAVLLGLDRQDLCLFADAESGLELNRAEEIADHIYQTNLKARVCVEAGAFRQRLMQHLEACLDEAGATSRHDLMLCDLGYNLTAQDCLRDILHHEGHTTGLNGRYLITLQGALNSLSGADSSRGYLVNFGLPRNTAAVFGRCSGVLDHFCAIAEGTVVNYSDDGTPICQSTPITPDQLGQVEEIQAGVLEFARAWADNPQKPDDHSNPEFIKHLLPILNRMLANPSGFEIQHFGGWHHDMFSSSSKTVTMIDIEKATNYFLQQGKNQIDINDVLNMPYDIQPWLFGFTRSLGDELHRQAMAAYGF